MMFILFIKLFSANIVFHVYDKLKTVSVGM